MEWGDWRPEIDATLLYVVRDGEILLIYKKRGIGAGKLNGAGGKVVRFDDHTQLRYGKEGYANPFFIAYSPDVQLMSAT